MAKISRSEHIESIQLVELTTPPALPSAGFAQLYMAGPALYLSRSTGDMLEVGPNWHAVADGRLTLTTGVPVTTADVTAATVLKYTPHIGNQITLLDSTYGWRTRAFNEVSLDLTGLTENTNYDAFAYLNSGNVALDKVAWASDIARTYDLARVNGTLVKGTDAVPDSRYRYVGSFRTSGAGQCEDSIAKRFVWNAYNQERRFLSVVDPLDSWTQAAAAAWRQAGANAANKVEMVLGLPYAAVTATALGLANGVSGVERCNVGIGVDATNVNSAQLVPGGGAAFYMQKTASYRGYPGIGYHYLAWLEITQAATITWYGDSGLTYSQSGLVAEVWM